MLGWRVDYQPQTSTSEPLRSVTPSFTPDSPFTQVDADFADDFEVELPLRILAKSISNGSSHTEIP